MNSKAWDVYLSGKLIDTVWFDADCSEKYVRDALIDHDGYHPGVVVKLAGPEGWDGSSW